MIDHITINNREIGPDRPIYIIAEISANHNQDFNKAVKLIEEAKKAGADAVKLQTYTPDTITINCDNEYFRINGTIWEGLTLYDLYSKAYTPWEWQPKLKKIAEKLGLDCFSSPFDESAVDFLEDMNVPAYKIASFEIVDLPLLRKIAMTGKPIIMSTGMASLAEIDEAVRIVRENGGNDLALLKCSSVYPAPPEAMNLRTIPHLAESFNVPVGISDHTLGIEIPVAAATLGACIVEKHFIISREEESPDRAFSLEPEEFKSMVRAVRMVEKALGRVQYEITNDEKASRVYRRSLFVVEDLQAGEKFTEMNVRSIRPGHGLHTKFLNCVIGRKTTRDIKFGTPLSWSLVEGSEKETEVSE